jgi:hypothetical protein
VASVSGKTTENLDLFEFLVYVKISITNTGSEETNLKRQHLLMRKHGENKTIYEAGVLH